MKKDLTMRLAIFACMLIGSALLAFVEIGIATAFDMKFNGLTYMEYVHEFYAVPWHFIVALGIIVIAFVISGESIYRSLKSFEKN